MATRGKARTSIAVSMSSHFHHKQVWLDKKSVLWWHGIAVPHPVFGAHSRQIFYLFGIWLSLFSLFMGEDCSWVLTSMHCGLNGTKFSSKEWQDHTESVWFEKKITHLVLFSFIFYFRKTKLTPGELADDVDCPPIVFLHKSGLISRVPVRSCLTVKIILQSSGVRLEDYNVKWWLKLTVWLRAPEGL